MECRRFTRLTYAFSKKLANLTAAVALHYAHYNFVRIHRTLRVTPAMAAGVSDRLWSVEELMRRQLTMGSSRGFRRKSTHIQVRRLAQGDAESYRDIRLDALRCNPEAYGSTFEAEDAQPLTWFAHRLGGSAVFGAFDGPELVGIAGLLIGTGKKQAHKGVLWGMYVRPGSRKAGIGRRLVETIIELARHQIELLQLSVVSDNKEARRLYASLGFLEYGIEKNALKQDGHYYDEVLMTMDL
jgi:ribosomal protein S18 acetylase RimI-like enzyme